jgi:D-hexose-6-phosphate mutarotase
MNELLDRAAAAGARAAAGGGHGDQINIYHPHSDVDVIRAREKARYLDQQKKRGTVPVAWPANLHGAPA